MMENNIKVWFDDLNIYYQDEFGDIFNHPLELFPKLQSANEQQRLAFEFSPFGIHWPKLDEDLSFEGFKRDLKLAHR